MIGYLILAVLVAFIAVVAIRTIRFRPKPQPEVTKEEIAFDHLEETVSGQLGRIEAMAEEVNAENGASYTVTPHMVTWRLDAGP